MSDAGYKEVFDSAQKKSREMDYAEVFPFFHDYFELFHFIVAPHYQSGNDGRALQQAREINESIYNDLYSKGPSLLGNGSQEIDGVESRHILIYTYMLDKLGMGLGNVVEIGGGYGNCLRLIHDMITFDSWTIIDLDYINGLQEWFLRESGVNVSKVVFVNSNDKPYQSLLRPDLVIGTHSLSEFALEDFLSYYPVIQKARWFFYVSQGNNPSKELLEKKQAIIRKDFELRDRVEYEDGASIIHLFENRT